MGAFAATVTKWAQETEARTQAVLRSSAQRVANEVRETVNEGGRMPIVTGNLRRSLLASTTAMPTTAAADTKFAESDISLVIQGLEVGETLYLGFQANYARRLNFGFVAEDKLGRTYNQAGFHFVEGVAARWQQIVNEEAIRLQGQVAGAFARP